MQHYDLPLQWAKSFIETLNVVKLFMKFINFLNANPISELQTIEN